MRSKQSVLGSKERNCTLQAVAVVAVSAVRMRGTGAGGDHECGMAGRAVTGKDRGKLSWGLLSSRSPLETRARCRHPLRHIGDGCPLWGMQLDATRIACRDSNAQCALVATV